MYNCTSEMGRKLCQSATSLRQTVSLINRIINSEAYRILRNCFKCMPETFRIGTPLLIQIKGGPKLKLKLRKSIFVSFAECYARSSVLSFLDPYISKLISLGSTAASTETTLV
jgi:hypothetical protein